MIPQTDKLKDRQELIDLLSDKLIKLGMPSHCGVCKKYIVCVNGDPHKICPWLKMNKSMLLKFKSACVLLFLFSFSVFAYAATPTLGTVSPSSGSVAPDTAKSFVCKYSDTSGWKDLKEANLLISVSSTTLANAAYLYYNQNNNLLYLRNDSNTSWSGGYRPGTNNVIENSQVRLNCVSTSVLGSSVTMSVTFNVTFKQGYSGKTYNLYLAAKNDAGTSVALTSKGTCLIIEPGTVVGPNGGDVTSSDGKVKLQIPQGALPINHGIEVLPVASDSLASSVPGGTALLSVVECKPYGLVFNKPVSLIYILPQAEIPGTPVELGLYDSAQKKINPTGQTSIISKDGYEAAFSLSHFSTYAALKSLIPQGAPIGGGVKIPLPDMFMGAFGHSIPISVSPGRKGIQPGLGLSYRSGNANSWVGQGVSLNPGYIVRSTRLGPPAYDDIKDTFYFITDAGTTELVHLIDNLYQAKIESSFTKFFKEADDSWRAVGKDGSVLRFGQMSDAREGSILGTFSWYITKVIDTNRNYVEYSYSKDQGKCYLSRIDYAGNEMGVSPTNSVEFILEPREDIFSSYISTSKIVTAKRLKEVITKVNDSVVWRYMLEYTYSPDTSRSLLTSVTQYASDNKNLPVQRFTYQKSND